ncbi:MAG: hypothetical protein AB7G39_00615 [Alphaproteobacteria bacterium]
MLTDRKWIRSTAIVLGLALVSPVLAACEEEGPMEQLGEKADEAVKDTQRAVQDAGD